MHDSGTATFLLPAVELQRDTPSTPPPSLSNLSNGSTPVLPETSTSYPRSTPITPPSPVLSVSHLTAAKQPLPTKGSIPIFFDSDSDDDDASSVFLGGVQRRSASSCVTHAPEEDETHQNAPAGSLSAVAHAMHNDLLQKRPSAMTMLSSTKSDSTVDTFGEFGDMEEDSESVSVHTTMSFVCSRPESYTLQDEFGLSIGEPRSRIIDQYQSKSGAGGSNTTDNSTDIATHLSSPTSLSTSEEIQSNLSLPTSSVQASSPSPADAPSDEVLTCPSDFSLSAYMDNPELQSDIGGSNLSCASTSDPGSSPPYANALPPFAEHPPVSTPSAERPDTARPRQLSSTMSSCSEFKPGHNPIHSAEVKDVKTAFSKLNKSSRSVIDTTTTTTNTTGVGSHFAQRVSEQYERQLELQKGGGGTTTTISPLITVMNPPFERSRGRGRSTGSAMGIRLRSSSSAAGRRPQTSSGTSIIIGNRGGGGSEIFNMSPLSVSVSGRPSTASSSSHQPLLPLNHIRRPSTATAAVSKVEHGIGNQIRTLELQHRVPPNANENASAARRGFVSGLVGRARARSSSLLSSTTTTGITERFSIKGTPGQGPYSVLNSSDRTPSSSPRGITISSPIEQSVDSTKNVDPDGSDSGGSNTPSGVSLAAKDMHGEAMMDASELSHLRNVVVSLIIDQERFREITPDFVFNRYTRSPTSSTALSSTFSHATSTSAYTTTSTHQTKSTSSQSTTSTSNNWGMRSAGGMSGLIEYKMAQRQSWAFHHAAFDSPPTLRRLMLNGDQKRDYLSREASLVIKTNGVYAVRGTEDKGSIPWQFTYLVDDRRNSAGERMPGEKMLTPLSFSCAPELVFPQRAKKIGILQLAKKALLPKAVSCKLEPPKLNISTPPLSTTESIPAPHSGTESPIAQVLANDPLPNSLPAAHHLTIEYPESTLLPRRHKPSLPNLITYSPKTSGLAPSASLETLSQAQIVMSSTLKYSNADLGDEIVPTPTPSSRQFNVDLEKYSLDSPGRKSSGSISSNAPPYTRFRMVSEVSLPWIPSAACKNTSAAGLWEVNNPTQKAIILSPTSCHGTTGKPIDNDTGGSPLENTIPAAVAIPATVASPIPSSRRRPATADPLLKSEIAGIPPFTSQRPLQISIPPPQTHEISTPIANREQIRAWLSETPPPIASPRLFASTLKSTPSPIPSSVPRISKFPPISSGSNRSSQRSRSTGPVAKQSRPSLRDPPLVVSSRFPSASVPPRRPATSHSIPRKPVPY